MATLEDIDTSLITVGQPTTGGCVYACIGTPKALPTDAATEMSTLTDFESCGLISENGFTLAKSVTKSKFKEWGGNNVLTATSEKELTFKLEFLEISRPIVAKLKHGSKNVEVGEDGSVSHIKEAGIEADEKVALVIDELESSGFLRRTVIPCVTVDSFDDEVHTKGSLLTYGMTFTAIVKENTNYDEYRAKPATA